MKPQTWGGNGIGWKPMPRVNSPAVEALYFTGVIAMFGLFEVDHIYHFYFTVVDGDYQVDGIYKTKNKITSYDDYTTVKKRLKEAFDIESAKNISIQSLEKIGVEW